MAWDSNKLSWLWLYSHWFLFSWEPHGSITLLPDPCSGCRFWRWCRSTGRTMAMKWILRKVGLFHLPQKLPWKSASMQIWKQRRNYFSRVKLPSSNNCSYPICSTQCPTASSSAPRIVIRLRIEPPYEVSTPTSRWTTFLAAMSSKKVTPLGRKGGVPSKSRQQGARGPNDREGALLNHW